MNLNLQQAALQIVLGSMLLLSGCGGGGGSSGPGEPAISAGSPPSGATGVAYPGYAFTVASGGAAPFVWSETGTLPPGLSFSTTGQLSGTPVMAGTYPVTIKVADSSMPPLTATLPVRLAIEDSPIVISAAPPPEGVVNKPYAGFMFRFMFSVASGGSPPFTWVITSGALPDGLALASDGLLAGTPTATGSFPFTVTATDSAPTPATSSAAFTVAIDNPPPPTINSASPPTATVGVVYSGFQFTATGGLAPLVWSETGPLPGLAVSLDGVLSGTPSSAGHFPITLDVKDALNRSAPSAPFTVRVALARPAAAFTATGSMSVARVAHAVTLLLDGKALVTGGLDASGLGLASAELYDPSTGLFTVTGDMTVVHAGHTATLLANATLPNYGKVLIAGGDSGGAAAELYDPVTGIFTATGSMTVARIINGPTATLLNTGQVLVAGGDTSTAELYDPASETFTATGNMAASRAGHTATLLLDGRVLVTGGWALDGGSLATAELYDPASGTFTATGDMAASRAGHTATRLQDGTVLVVGPENASPEVYDAGTGTFTAVGDLSPYWPSGGVYGHTASLRADGTVLIAGGWGWTQLRTLKLIIGHFRCIVSGFPSSRTTTALYAPEAEGFTATGGLNTARDGHTATVLADGTVLVVGGVLHTARNSENCSGLHSATWLSSAELFK